MDIPYLRYKSALSERSLNSPLKIYTIAFLIRDPRLSIPSLYKMRQDFHEKEAGFSGQVKLYEKIHELGGIAPHVFDAEVLTSLPQETVSTYFRSINRSMPNDALNWEAGTRSDWQGRESWHIEAIQSCKFFHTPKTIDESTLPIRVKEIIKQNLPRYHYLHGKIT